MTFSPTIPYPLTIGQTTTVAATTVSNAVALGTFGEVLLVQNDGSVTAFFALGTSVSTTAVAGGVASASSDGSIPILAGSSMLFRAAPGITYIAAVTAAGSTTLRVSRGDGT